MTESNHSVNTCGIAHRAFEVDDVEATLQRLLEKGGKQIGEVVKDRLDALKYTTLPEPCTYPHTSRFSP